MVLERRRRFAGESFGMGGDQAAALREATEQLKSAQEALRQQQATSAAPAPTAAAAPAASAVGTTDIAGLRKQLGIDDLLSSVGKLQTQQAEAPKFEMPQFEMPQFEPPDWSSMMPDFGSLLQQYLPQPSAASESAAQSTPTGGGTGPEGPKQPRRPGGQKPAGQQKPAGTRIDIGDGKYNLSATGGAGLGMGDIRNLQNKGLGKGQIRKVAEQTKAAGLSVSKGAQSFLNQTKANKDKPSATAKTQAKTMTNTARKNIAAAAKPAASKPAAAKPAARRK